jgi:large subunit ribosomal protein L13
LPDPSEPTRPASPTVIDVSGLVVGRAASLIAQRLIAGESIVVIRAEKAVVTGSRASVLETYRASRARGSVRSGPHYPRNPDRIFRRAVRGMVPHLKSRGKAAFDRLTVYIGCPEVYAKLSASSLPDAQARPTLRAPLTLQEVSRLLGARV